MMSVLDRTLAKVSVLSRWGALAGGGMLLASVLLISFDVLARKLFNSATTGSNELSGYVLAISTSWALAFGVLEKVNVRVDVLYRSMPVRVAALFDLFAVAALAVFVMVVTYYAIVVFSTSYEEGAAANTNLGTPLWIPQGLWVLGLVWMVLVQVLVFLRALLALATGHVSHVVRLCGPRGSTEEAEEEVRMASRRAEQQGVPA